MRMVFLVIDGACIPYLLTYSVRLMKAAIDGAEQGSYLVFQAPRGASFLRCGGMLQDVQNRAMNPAQLREFMKFMRCEELV